MSAARSVPAPLLRAPASPTFERAAPRELMAGRVDATLWARARARMRARGDRACEVLEWALRAYLQATEGPCDGGRRATRSRRK